MKFYPLITIFMLFSFALSSQKKVMDPSVYYEWSTINSEAISNDGQWVKYHKKPGKGDETLNLYNVQNETTVNFDRVKRSYFTEDSHFLVFSNEAAEDTVTLLKRQKVEKKNMPKDSLFILNLANFRIDTIPEVGSFKLPKEDSGIIAYQSHIKIEKPDSTGTAKTEQRFFIHHLDVGYRDTLVNVDGFEIPENGKRVIYYRNGTDTSLTAGIFFYDVDTRKQTPVMNELGKYSKIATDKAGEKISFVADLDTTKRRLRPYSLYLWDQGVLSEIVKDQDRLSSEEHFITENTSPQFSDNGKILYFGIGEQPVLADSLALDEDMVQVEVWTTEDPMLYTMQEVQKDQLEKETFQVRYDIKEKKFHPLESTLRKNLTKSQKGNGLFFLVANSLPYAKALTWSGNRSEDLYLLNGETGKELEIAHSFNGNAQFSPEGKYVYWFDGELLDWYTYDVSSGKMFNLTNGMKVDFVDELNDVPAKPNSYRMAGWTPGDNHILIYDRYDIWKFDPSGNSPAVRLTDGRNSQISSRIIEMDSEKEYVDTLSLIYIFDEVTKESGYARLNIMTGKEESILKGPFSLRQRPLKAKNAAKMLFTKESFELFPDLILADSDFKNQVTISDVNPQQSDYLWGSIELFSWSDFNGDKVQGLLVKPDNFDPSKKYPVIVNFYERSSDGLYRHRAPEPHRSTINYSYYASKGYIIFNPDVKYTIGEPGQSAYDAVVSGVEALSKNQFIDKLRIGVQGHSWGGYQIAYLLNKTDIFRCAESGAPVVNMVSAYGGIRWGSGMSRMFQYEQTQSRLGKTLWEDQELYLKNSPIFELDQTNTPVLILHNDNDSAVPWYQGIEYFMALRRLGKQAWFLNYNGEPHWPLKWENRLDFNKRMEQFFDHYLKDQQMPMWMKNGVSVKDKGINQGFELEEGNSRN